MGSLEEKKQVVADIRDRLNRAQSVVVVEYRGLKVSEQTELRAKLRDVGVEMKVYKNTLVKLAADDNNVVGVDQFLEGPTAWAFSIQDPVAAPKVMMDFAKTHKMLVVKGGILENKAIDVEAVEALASLPSREVLLAKVLAGMQAPLYGMANVLQGPLRKFVYAVEALRQKEEQA